MKFGYFLEARRVVQEVGAMVSEVFGAFLEGSPVSVMFRATLERILSAPKMDAIFSQAAARQKTGELLFSTCVNLMALVVAKTRKSVHAAYRAQADQIQVSVRSIYNKLAGIEPQVSERMVATTAAEMVALLPQIGVRPQAPLPDYEVRLVDGNYLGGTEHRLAELRQLGAAALPGMTLCIFDPQWQLVRDVIACPDGHANERSLVARVLPKVEAGQCWVADRNFCFFAFLFGIAAGQAFFVVRHHPQVVGELLGKRRKLKRVEGGTLYEQRLQVINREGQSLVLRRITIELDQPTRFDETQLHLLTNLPPQVGAEPIVAAYRNRWSLETAFMHLATVLRSEVNTLGYPDAALFGFSIGLLLYNVLAFLEAALRTAHRRKLSSHSLSMYYLADEISGVYRGMMIAIPAHHWTQAYATLSPEDFAKQMLWLAKKVEVTRLFANPPSQKKPPPKRQSGYRGNHVSTFKILQQRNQSR
jgi:IS4 transposase